MSLPQLTSERILNLDKTPHIYLESVIQELVGEIFDDINHEGYPIIRLMVRRFAPSYNIQAGYKSDRPLIETPLIVGDIDLSQQKSTNILSDINQSTGYIPIVDHLISQSYHSTGSKKLIKQIIGSYDMIEGRIIFSHAYPIRSLLTKKGLDPSFNVKDVELYVFQGIKEAK